MKKYLLLLSFIIIHFSLTAQVKISGSTKDHKGRKLIGVSITLKNSYDGAVSDSMGNFSFKQVKPF